MNTSGYSVATINQRGVGMDERMKPQAVSGPDDAAKTRMAMQVGAAMSAANVELSRPDAGVEVAGLAGRASRAALLAFNDATNNESPGFSLPLLIALVQQAYAVEWQRLMCTDREAWRA